MKTLKLQKNLASRILRVGTNKAKTFDGKLFRSTSAFSHKKDAQEHAKSIKKYHRVKQTRIIKDKTQYGDTAYYVYKRGKKRK